MLGAAIAKTKADALGMIDLSPSTRSCEVPSGPPLRAAAHGGS